MVSICFYFEVHQPFRLRPYHFFDVGADPHYLDEEKNREVCKKVASKCYLPTNKLLLDLIKKYGADFRITFSVSGTALDQFRMYSPETLESFQRLADTGQVEFLNETYYHSLSALYSEREFRSQVQKHGQAVRELFGQSPVSFRNTELIYSNHIAWLARDMGFQAILLEGTEKILDWRSPNFVYTPEHTPGIKCLLKNYKLSDDVAFRFSDKNWKEWPMSADKFAGWVHQVAGNGTNINLFMDYETFGEHQWEDSGIFQFLKDLPARVLRKPDFAFRTVTQVARQNEAVGTIDTNEPISWADLERDLSAWRGNSMQNEALNGIYELEEPVYASQNPDFLEIFRKLQTSDHFYYMSTKYWSDGDVHKYFSPYSTPHDAYIYYMNVLHDFRQRLGL
ncbi:MAG: glycoside hydrolase family 57 protein [Spirochaetia bacterium]|nr:glycoside hydrolase family 57 protein [Spirochaetia bacterium]